MAFVFASCTASELGGAAADAMATCAAEAAGTEAAGGAAACNHASMELEATQAAGVVLGVKSYGASDELDYHSGWDHIKVEAEAEHGLLKERPALADVAHDEGSNTCRATCANGRPCGHSYSYSRSRSQPSSCSTRCSTCVDGTGTTLDKLLLLWTSTGTSIFLLLLATEGLLRLLLLPRPAAAVAGCWLLHVWAAFMVLPCFSAWQIR